MAYIPYLQRLKEVLTDKKPYLVQQAETGAIWKAKGFCKVIGWGHIKLDLFCTLSISDCRDSAKRIATRVEETAENLPCLGTLQSIKNAVVEGWRLLAPKLRHY